MDRLEIQTLLKNLLGSENVYFQPADSIRLTYPCIVYKFATFRPVHADNNQYIVHDRYEGIYITKDPDDDFKRTLLSNLEYCSIGTRYVADNLYHDPFTFYS